MINVELGSNAQVIINSSSRHIATPSHHGPGPK